MKTTAMTNSSVGRPPVVAVLGHVDHGKTTLLDAIRKSHVALGEHGGITQHIGAYQIVVPLKDGPRKITFIDTPGHEAFDKMRSRGANASDVALLVVAADDSVKPQTIESIKQIQSAKVSMIVVVNKIDTPGANIDKVKQDLAKNGVQVEGFGGEIPLVAVSAKQGQGIDELLTTILLVFDVKKTDEVTSGVSAQVIETRLDKGKGMIATAIIRSGILRTGMALYVDDTVIAKVRALFDESGALLKEAEVGKPVEIVGFITLPPIGSIVYDQPQKKTIVPPPINEVKKDVLPDFLRPLSEIKQTLSIILKADTTGSLEAVVESLDKQVLIVSSGVGDITEADILDAKANKAFVIGFNVKARGSVVKLAETEKVVFRLYTIIYELIDELSEVVSGMTEVLTNERELGMATVIAEFPFNGLRIAGVRVVSGRVAKGDFIKILRNEEEIGRTRVKSVRQFKNEVTKVEKGNECGILLEKEIPFAIDDTCILFTK